MPLKACKEEDGEFWSRPHFLYLFYQRVISLMSVEIRP